MWKSDNRVPYPYSNTEWLEQHHTFERRHGENWVRWLVTTEDEWLAVKDRMDAEFTPYVAEAFFNGQRSVLMFSDTEWVSDSTEDGGEFEVEQLDGSHYFEDGWYYASKTFRRGIWQLLDLLHTQDELVAAGGSEVLSEGAL